MTFGTHGSFYLRDGWMYKLIHAVEENPKIFGQNDAPVYFGVGKNMVPAIRYWGLASRIISYNRGTHTYALTQFGRLVRDNDIYLEKLNTLWLIHINLLKSKNYTSTWHWLFNIYGGSSLELDIFPDRISSWISSEFKSLGISKPTVSPVTLKKDIRCLVQLYTKNSDKKNPDDNVISPLSRLSIIEDYGSKLRIQPPMSNKVPPIIFEYALIDYLLNTPEVMGEKEKIELGEPVRVQKTVWELLNDHGSPGRVLRVSPSMIYNYLSTLKDEESKYKIQLNRTSGMDVLTIHVRGQDQDVILHRAMEGI